MGGYKLNSGNIRVPVVIEVFFQNVGASEKNFEKKFKSDYLQKDEHVSKGKSAGY